MIGTVLSNRYKLIAELGSGGMAWVYLAEDLIQGGQVAVKILYPQHSKDLLFVQRFNREARLSMSLSQASPQPNTVRILDYGADRDTHYLVMEYVPGQDLGEILEQQGPLPWEKALDLTRQVALALEHAYELDIVHRDIKPSNIMVLPDGTARVLDFGIARVRTSPHLTIAGFVGSPHYAAPEQARGESVDIRADIYSLGIVLYRMLSGDLPYQGDTPWAVVNKHVAAQPPPLEDLRPDLPEAVVHLVQKAMAKDPKDRFQTPNEMVQAIDGLLSRPDPRSEARPAEPIAAVADLAALYDRAQQAAQQEHWQEAVDLYSQVLKANPEYRDAIGQLDAAAQQLRLVTLYRSAQRALELGQWDQALGQLERIAAIDPEYREIAELKARAESKEALPAGRGASVPEFPTHVPTAAEPAEPPASTTTPEPGPAAEQAPPGGRRRRWLLLAGGAILVLLLAALGYAIFAAVGAPEPTPAVHVSPSPSSTVKPTGTSAAVATVLASATNTRQPDAPAATATGAVTTPTSSAAASPTRTLPAPSATSSRTPTVTATPTFTPTIPAPTRPALSGQIAFPRFDPARGTYDVYACKVDGSGCQLVYAGASQPDFLPGGNRLVVHTWNPEEKGLTLITRSGERVWRITDQVEAARPSVDFKGELYVYHSRQESDRQPRLYRTYGAETGPIVREASVVQGQSPSWLPDGRILYTGCWQDACGILSIRADGTFPGQIVAGANEANPESSPDGRQVAFMSRRDGNWEVYIASIDGGEPKRLTTNAANDGLPTWSPDGRHIAFVTDREGAWAVWVMRSDGSGQRRLFDLGGPLDGQVRDAALHESHGWVEERISWARLP
ncbi:MAG: protein kinase domain-containing protein [Anaerolineae bacterium]